jgi:hypothetical protein
MADQACWVCGRSLNELNAMFKGKTSKETTIEEQEAKVRKDRADFRSASGRWGEGSDTFSQFDFVFVLNNKPQFKKIRYLDDIETAKKGMVDRLGDMRKSRIEVSLGEVSADELNKQKEFISGRLDAFEKATGRKISAFEGLNFRDGLDYIGKSGLFYYDLQLEALDKAKASAAQERPSGKIEIVKLKSMPRDVPVCAVCMGLFKELRA